MNVLVTGSNGFIGKHVVRGLEDAGYDVTGFDWPENLCELGSVEGFDAVVNLAAIGGAGRAARNPREVFKNNAVAAISLRGALRSKPPFLRSDEEPGPWPHVVHVSSFSVYGDAEVPTAEGAPLRPKEVYGASKLAQELAWTGYPGVVRVLRLSSVYGPGMRLDDPESTVIAKIAKAARDGEGFEVFEDGLQERDFVHVDDVVAMIARALELCDDDKATPGLSGVCSVINVCSGRGTTILQACELLGARPNITGRKRAGDMRVCRGDPAKMIGILRREPHAFTPRDILSGAGCRHGARYAEECIRCIESAP